MEFNYNHDKENMRGVLLNFVKHIKEGQQLASGISIGMKPTHIHVQGMGGSAISGDILSCYLSGSEIKVTVGKDYSAPKNIGKDTLSFVISYSGNTEETISAYREIMKSGSKAVVLSTGGKLKELAKMNGDSYISIPSGLQPRQALGYLFFSMLQVLKENNVVAVSEEEIKSVVDMLSKDSYEQVAKDLAIKLAGKIPLIYTSSRLYAVANRWKANFNENSKVHAFTNVFPELNHNELNAFADKSISYFVITLRDDEENKNIARRMKATKEILKQNDVDVVEIMLRGEFFLTKMFMGIYMADWVSYYLALVNERDPTPIPMISEFKENLKKMTRI